MQCFFSIHEQGPNVCFKTRDIASTEVRVFNLREGWARKVGILGPSFSLERENFQSTIDKLNVRLRSGTALAWLDAALDPGKELSPEDVETATADISATFLANCCVAVCLIPLSPFALDSRL